MLTVEIKVLLFLFGKTCILRVFNRERRGIQELYQNDLFISILRFLCRIMGNVCVLTEMVLNTVNQKIS